MKKSISLIVAFMLFGSSLTADVGTSTGLASLTEGGSATVAGATATGTTIAAVSVGTAVAATVAFVAAAAVASNASDSSGSGGGIGTTAVH